MLKKILTILAGILFIGTSFATYKLKASEYQRTIELTNKIIKVVEKKYPPNKQKYVFWVLVDSIDGYIALHKISEKKKVVLLLIKTLLLKHMGYKFSNTKKIIIISE